MDLKKSLRDALLILAVAGLVGACQPADAPAVAEPQASAEVAKDPAAQAPPALTDWDRFVESYIED